MNESQAERLKRLKYRQYIKTFNHPALSVVCDPIVAGDDLSFLQKMKRACEATRTGVGLAAPQIGVTKRAIFIAHKGKPSYFMLNPVIAHRSEDKVTLEEGCLSYPDVYGPVERSRSILVEFYRPDDLKLESLIAVTVEGFEARIIQHEVDHLDGICRVRDFWIVNSSIKQELAKH